LVENQQLGEEIGNYVLATTADSDENGIQKAMASVREAK
jgi:hypothetical protein